jgi:hypothetical protein
VSQNVTEAVEEVQSGLDLSSIQFSALMEWYQRYSEQQVIPQMISDNYAATGVSDVSYVPLYQWATANYVNVSSTLYLGEDANLELWYYSGGVNIDPESAYGLFFGQLNLSDPTNVGVFLTYFSMGASSIDQLATWYSLDDDQISAVGTYLETIIGGLASASVFVQSSYLFRADTVNSTFSF